MTAAQAARAQVFVRTEPDIAVAVHQVRRLAAELGMDDVRAARLATVTSELASNIVKYGVRGVVTVSEGRRGRRRYLKIVAEDRGPGIPDLEEAMRDHASTGGTLGLGLPGVRRLSDAFELRSEPGQGCVVEARLWLDG